MANGLLFSLSKGLLYGTAVGLFFGIAIFLLASSVVGMGFLVGITAVQLAGLIFANGIMSGISFEYSSWLAKQKNKGLLFLLAKGFLYGVTLGLYLGIAIFLVALAVAGLGFLVGITAVQLAGLVFATMILSGVGIEYGTWLEARPQETSK